MPTRSCPGRRRAASPSSPRGSATRATPRPTMRTFARTLARTGVLQVDSVNVLQRAHYMPLFSRMGPYDTGMLKRASEQKPRRMVEYWAHVQAFMPVELWPVMRPPDGVLPRRARRWGAWLKTNPGIVDRVLGQVRDGGASTARDLDDGRPAAQGRLGLELVGDPQGARLPLRGGRPRDRRPQLRSSSRSTTCPSACCPPRSWRRRCRTPFEATKELVRRAARSHGVATVALPRRLLPAADPARGGAAGRAPAPSTSWSRTASCCR